MFFKKKVFIFAQGIGPINSFAGQLFARLLLKNCYFISVRDSKSQELLNNWGIKSELICDPIFSIDVPKNKKTKTLAIQLRSCKGLSMDFLDRLADEVCKNFKDYKIEIYSFQDSIDLEVCQTFEQKLKLLSPDINTTLYSGLTNSQIIEKISFAQYLISMRFHAIITGLLTNTNTLAINYDIKVEKLAVEFGLPAIDLKKEFNNQFELLKNQNLSEINTKISALNFDWDNFEKAIN